LTSCARWCLNGCRDIHGEQSEANCGTSYYPPHWEDYRGLAADQDCTMADCLCNSNSGNFDSAVGKLITCSREYCGMPISKPDAPYPPYDAMQNVFVNYCLRLGYAHHNYTTVIVGVPATGNSTTLNGTSTSSNAASTPTSNSNSTSTQSGVLAKRSGKSTISHST
jgi:hypothetical protein